MSAWAHFHPNCDPLNYELSHAEPDCWLRFHYARSIPADASISDRRTAALQIMTTAAAAALGDGTECWISGPLYPPHDLAYARQLAVLKLLDMSRAGRVLLLDDDGELDIYAVLTNWVPNRFNDVFLQIENDDARLMWMNANTGAVFAPYDRGVDLILPTTDDVRRMAYEYSGWLSSYPDGW